MSTAAMSNFDDAAGMVETMMEHESIKKAMLVFEETDAFDELTEDEPAEEIAEEYCQFMALKILSGDFSAADAKLSPGGTVDAFWHCHILDTVGYAGFFQAAFPPLGPIVHHDATKSRDSRAAIEARQEETKELYEAIFNEDCPFFSHDNTLPVITKAKVYIETRFVVVRNPFTINYKMLTGKTGRMDIGPNNTAEHLKMLINREEGIPTDQLHLLFAREELEDNRTMADYGIVEGSDVHVCICLRGC